VPPVETEAAVKNLGRRFLSIDANLFHHRTGRAHRRRNGQRLGGIDILVNNPASSAAPTRSTSQRRIGTTS